MQYLNWLCNLMDLKIRKWILHHLFVIDYAEYQGKGINDSDLLREGHVLLSTTVILDFSLYMQWNLNSLS